jgi:hypothetical protein
MSASPHSSDWSCTSARAGFTDHEHIVRCLLLIPFATSAIYEILAAQKPIGEDMTLVQGGACA